MLDDVRLSKFFSYVLRHQPEKAGVSVDKEGWLDVDALIEAARRKGFLLDRARLETIVATSDKKRFTLTDDGRRIRAAQGHSTAQVDITHVRRSPPAILCHGTAEPNIASILEQGLHPGRRHYVHLSVDERTAVAVGRRHGDPVVFLVDARSMEEAGAEFYLAENGVWLTRFVGPEFLTRRTDGG